VLCRRGLMMNHTRRRPRKNEANGPTVGIAQHSTIPSFHCSNSMRSCETKPIHATRDGTPSDDRRNWLRLCAGWSAGRKRVEPKRTKKGAKRTRGFAGFAFPPFSLSFVSFGYGDLRRGWNWVRLCGGVASGAGVGKMAGRWGLCVCFFDKEVL
jgi:hypothetical protein